MIDAFESEYNVWIQCICKCVDFLKPVNWISVQGNHKRIKRTYEYHVKSVGKQDMKVNGSSEKRRRKKKENKRNRKNNIGNISMNTHG